ncbi:MAG: protein phosphatase 2C domain-containing protein [Gammaproteobacteria bacterium]|jgi:serine/threonine protein phosphatase PrpC|nr:protein phosphatase 2C domain-containing protein [Gammaproteobacteria bacterium]
MEIRLLGRDHDAAGIVAYHQAVFGTAVVEVAICAGGEAAAGKPNEDALLVVPPEAEGEAGLALVADAHFGQEAAELAVAAVAEGWARAAGDERREPEETLLRLVRAAQAALSDAGSESETTLLLVVLQGAALHWASVGDSYLYRIEAGGRARVVNRVDRVWLGARLVVPVHEVTRRGRFDLAPGSRVLLATDGIPEAVRNVPTLRPRQVAAALDGGGDGPLQALVRVALDRGGEDNIAAVLITAPGAGAETAGGGGGGAWASAWRSLTGR